MKVTKTNDGATKIKLVISADQYDLTPIKDHVLTHFVDKVNVPGFRAGTAPAALIEKYVDQNALNDEFVQHALNDLYGKAVDQEKLRPAAKPEVQLKKFVPYTEMEFEVEIETIGPIELPDYKKIKVAKKPVDVTAKEIDEVLNSLRQQAAMRNDVDRPAKEGDELVIDFSGQDKEGQKVANTDGKDIPVILGSKKFIPGFEDNLIGLKAGAEKKFEIIFPKDYGVKAMQSKPVTFSVTIKKVSELTEPKLDDDFAAKIGPFKTLAELKADIKKQLTIEKESQVQRDFENELVHKITEKAKIDVPKSLVDEQVMAAEQTEKNNLAGRGITWGEHLDEEGLTEEQHRARQRPEAEQRVKASLVLSEIAEKEDISITQDEIETRINLLKARYEDAQMRGELDVPENQRQIASQLMTEKTVAKLVEYANK